MALVGGSGRNPRVARRGAEACSGDGGRTKSEALMGAVVARANMWTAYGRVLGNKGAAGVDGMATGALADHLKAHWANDQRKLLAGTYVPAAVRKVEILKPREAFP